MEMETDDYTCFYEELDPAIVELCRAINELPGLMTISSCQGFIDGHRKGEPWHVMFAIREVSPASYWSLTHVVAMIQDYKLCAPADAVVDDSVLFNRPRVAADVTVHSCLDCMLNRPALRFTIVGYEKEGYSDRPDDLALFIRKTAPTEVVGAPS